MTKTRTFLIPAFATALMFGVSVTPANAGPRGDSGQVFSQLTNVTEAQLESIKTLRAEFKQGRDEVRDSRENIKSMVELGNVDQAAEFAGQLASDRVHQRAEFQNRLATILTAAQMDELKQLRADKPKRRGKKRRGQRAQK
ncbi:MAG: hypothetical protein ABJG88_08475 [Litorimonas sp.]